MFVSSPVIVADDANIEVSARRIMWGKLLNSGQTCVAPDYVLCTPDTQDKLIEACKRMIEEFYGQVSYTMYEPMCNLLILHSKVTIL